MYAPWQEDLDRRTPAAAGPVPEPAAARWAKPGIPRIVAQIAAVVVLVAGVGGYFLGTRAVDVVDDGVARSVRTYAGTVAGLLHHTGLRVGGHDTVAPTRDTRLTDGGRVVIARGRPVTLTLDGVRKTRWVTARTVADLLAGLKLGDAEVELSAPRDARIPRAGMALTVNTAKRLTLVVDGTKRPLTTYAPTSTALLAEAKVKLAARDEVKPPRGATLAGATTVTVVRVTVRKATETVAVDPPVQQRKKSDWMLDQQRVVDDGVKGRAEQDVEYITRDGKFSERRVLNSRALTAARPKIVEKGTKPYPPDDTGLNWKALAACESGGNPRSVSSGGTYHGLYQFNVQMWRRMGGIGIPSQATPREQTYRAIRLYKAAGADQWPHCGPRLFS